MHIGYFVEQQYTGIPEEVVIENLGFFGLPNRYFDPAHGAALYAKYLEEYLEAERCGFDSMVLNEHHANPACMSHCIAIEAAALAARSHKAKIVLLGSPLPIMKNPLRAAEELGMVDMISGGRLVPGIIRGAAWEQVASNTNPAHNRELFDEAHDFIVKAWSEPGPWRHEGEHFHYRFVNPWSRPMSKRVPIWIPGVISPETVVWAAEHRYPYVALATELKGTAHMWRIYGETAERMGYQVGPENFGYFQKVVLADTYEEAYELGKGHVFGGSFTPGRFASMPGYNSKEAVRNFATKFYANVAVRITRKDDIAEQRKLLIEQYDRMIATNHIILGTPSDIIPKLKRVLDVLRPGILTIWGPEGPAPHEAVVHMLRRLGSEVLPEIREYADKLGLTDPFQQWPGERPLPADGRWVPLADEAAAAAA
jgi:alkanesulfonate monooxygenase SsuD/methylene tetrahydromethanopterin reductase-like flavin-dependent oxidoreductase (luciferase family)